MFAVAEKPTPPSKDVPEELMPANLVELETSCGEAASKAIAAYQKAVCVIQDYNKDVMRVVESLHATVGSAIWNRYFFLMCIKFSLNFSFNIIYL